MLSFGFSNILLFITMKSRRRYDAVATIATYKDKETGETKKIRQRIGTVFESESGRLSLKLDLVPICPAWSGFVSFCEPGEREGDEE